jgi:flagellar protein FlaF
MLRNGYEDIMADDPRLGRSVEREHICSSIELMREAEKAGIGSKECAEAVSFVSRLWGILIVELGQPENALPRELRAQLISVGLFLIKTVEEIRAGSSANFAAVIDVSQSVADGLA